jgi:hypothetical protein
MPPNGYAPNGDGVVRFAGVTHDGSHSGCWVCAELVDCGDERPSGAWSTRTYRCELTSDHEGERVDGRYSATWTEGAQTVLDPYGVADLDKVRAVAERTDASFSVEVDSTRDLRTSTERAVDADRRAS